MIDLREIRPVTDFQRNMKQYIALLKHRAAPLVLTVNGRAELVVQDAASYQALLERLDRARGHRCNQGRPRGVRSRRGQARRGCAACAKTSAWRIRLRSLLAHCATSSGPFSTSSRNIPTVRGAGSTRSPRPSCRFSRSPSGARRLVSTLLQTDTVVRVLLAGLSLPYKVFFAVIPGSNRSSGTVRVLHVRQALRRPWPGNGPA